MGRNISNQTVWTTCCHYSCSHFVFIQRHLSKMQVWPCLSLASPCLLDQNWACQWVWYRWPCNLQHVCSHYARHLLASDHLSHLTCQKYWLEFYRASYYFMPEFAPAAFLTSNKALLLPSPHFPERLPSGPLFLLLNHLRYQFMQEPLFQTPDTSTVKSFLLYALSASFSNFMSYQIICSFFLTCPLSFHMLIESRVHVIIPLFPQ